MECVVHPPVCVESAPASLKAMPGYKTQDRQMSSLTDSSKTKIRLATAADAEDIARLSGQLGYPSTADEALQRLQAINRYPEHAVFVAEANGALAGWMHVFVRPSLTTPASAELASLVVDEHCRSHGIGQALISQAERWAVEQGCRMVTLRSNVKRLRAHAFYERLGYETIKTSKSLRKVLG